MDGNSLDIKQQNLIKLKELMPEVFTEGNKIDFVKLKLTLGEDVELTNERYVLNWAGKSEAFKVLQTPTTATLAPDKDESVNFDTTDNIFIEGENLEVLKVLQKSYYGKIKMIYIDPPYNTGSDSFIYPDKFSETKDEYLKRIGEKDEEGYLLKEGLFRNNSKDNGHYHSNWLSMLYPRLFLAKNLLHENGVIFISIDDNEVHDLRLIMNEIYGEENFVETIIWQKKYSPQNDATYFSAMHDYILCYAKNKKIKKSDTLGWERILLARTTEADERYKNPDNDPRGDWKPGDYTAEGPTENCIYPIISPTGKEFWPPEGKRWVYNKDNYIILKEEKRLWFGEEGNSYPALKRFISEVQDGLVPNSIWFYVDVGHTQEGKKETNELFDGKAVFDYPKPIRLLKRIIDISTKDNDIILDFFAGSGPIAQALLESNLHKPDKSKRKFFLIQIPEVIDESKEAFKAGYKTISEICKDRIKKAIFKIKNEKEQNPQIFENNNVDLGFKLFKLKNSNFKLWRGDVIENGDDLTKQIDVFENPVREGTEEENILYELILKSGYELTTKIEKKEELYLIDENDLIIALNKIDEGIINNIVSLKPKKCITLDKLFNGNDQLKTNTVLQMKDAGIEFKTV